MKPHDTYLELAAMAIDYPLEASDHGRLDRHLASCPACARRAAAFRGDALALGNLPAVILPDRRGAEILAAALHPAGVANPLRLLVLAALLGLLLVGSLAVGAQLLRRDDDGDLVVVPPVAMATASAGPDASPGPDASQSADEPSGVLAVTHGDEIGGTWVELVTLGTGAVSPLGMGRDPAWFSDGRLVYACAKAQGENTAICMVNPIEDLQPEIASDATQPAPAPDGSLIAIHRGMVDVGETWIMAPDGSGSRLISAGAFMEWSPDGAWLLGQPESAGFQVAVVRVDGTDGGPQILATGYDPAWSPEGDRIAYAVVDGQEVRLRVMSPFTDVSETRYTTPATSELTAPAWLPDGRLVFVLDGDLYRLDAGSSEPVRLTTGLAIRADWFGDTLSVSPDGRWIAFSTGSGADARVGIASVDGGYRMLDLEDGPITQPQWAPGTGASPGTAATPEPSAAPVGRSWTQATVPVVVDRPVGRIEAVTAPGVLGPGFVAVGRGCIGAEPTCEAIVWTSLDGRAWVRAPASDATDIGAWFSTSGPEIGMFDVTSGLFGGGFVAIGYAARPDLQATTWFSADGTSWERIPLGLEPPATSPGGFNGARVNAVTWDGRSFVIVGEDRSDWEGFGSPLATAKARAAVWTSPDGRTWTRVPHAPVFEVGGFIDTTEDPESGGMRDVVAGPTGLVAVGSACTSKPAGCEPAAWTSSDGTTWVRVADMPALSGRLEAVAASETGYVAVGSESCDPSHTTSPPSCGGLVLTSTDGRAWVQQPFEGPAYLGTVTAIGDRFFATAGTGPDSLWVSTDGSAWAPAAVEGGPAAGITDTSADWHFAATSAVAVWLGMAKETDAPAAWVSGP